MSQLDCLNMLADVVRLGLYTLYYKANRAITLVRDALTSYLTLWPVVVFCGKAFYRCYK